MKLNGWYFAILPVGLLLTRSGFAAQVLLLGLTLGIFFGTLSLGRPSARGATSTSPGT